MLTLLGTVVGSLCEPVQWHRKRTRYFNIIEFKLVRPWHDANIRTYLEFTDGVMMIDIAKHLDIVGDNPDFLPRFTQCGSQQIIIYVVAFTAGKSDLSTVPISREIGSPDIEDMPGVLDAQERHQHRGFAGVGT